MTPIKLCLASQLYHPYYAGGALRYRGYLPGLRERQICTEVFTATPSQARVAKFSPGQSIHEANPGQMLLVERDQDTPVYRVRLVDNGSWRRVMQYGEALVQFCQRPNTRPDLIQFLPLPPWSIPALRKLRRMNIPLAYAYNLINAPQNSVMGRLRQMAARRYQFPLLDCVIVQSNVMAQSLRDQGFTGRIEIIPNGVDTVRFRPELDTAVCTQIRQSLGIAPDAPIIIYVGAIEPRKGSDLLFSAWVKAASELPRAHLVLVGPRLDLSDPALTRYHQKIETLIQASAAEDRVHFVGRVDNVAAYLQAANLFVFPSRREGLPNVMMEAMATGLPVITAPFIGLSPELGRADEHYLLADHDALHLAQLIKQVLSEASLAERLGQNGRTWVETHLDIETVLDKYADIYRELAG
ncbi:MAG: glycosyltransferase family 4 protein [Chloroflexi bacterium]|nr:glycosyltransferase family 4 protein [Chloroflexota bacterium]